MTTPLDTALDTLFATPIDAFMAKREELVKELRAGGHKDAAATLRSQHKPTVAAYALNRLARDAGPELEALFAVSRQLASGKDFKDALERQREAMEAVRAKVDSTHANDVVGVVRGAMVDQTLAAAVMLGRFSKIPAVQVGFFGAAPHGESPPRSKPTTAAPADRAPRAKTSPPGAEPMREIDRTELTRARAAREKARQEAEREKAAREKLAREKVERFERELAAAEEEAQRLSALADEAEQRAMEARQRAREAFSKVKEIRARRWE